MSPPSEIESGVSIETLVHFEKVLICGQTTMLISSCSTPISKHFISYFSI